METILFPGEAEAFVEALEEFQVEAVGSKQWQLQHERVEKLNQQAVASATCQTDEFVKVRNRNNENEQAVWSECERMSNYLVSTPSNHDFHLNTPIIFAKGISGDTRQNPRPDFEPNHHRNLEGESLSAHFEESFPWIVVSVVHDGKK